MKITDEAVEAAARVLVPVWFGGFEDQSEEGFPGTPNRRAINTARAALEAALPHLSQGAARVKPLDAYEPASTDTQEGVSEAGEVVGWAYEHHDFGDVWARGVILNRPDGGANPPTKHHGSPIRNVAPLVRQSALTACQQEVETLREGIKEIAEREQSIRDNWARHEAKTGARILELEELLQNALAAGLPDEVASPIRAVLGGQSNG